MGRRVDLKAIRKRATAAIDRAVARYDRAVLHAGKWELIYGMAEHSIVEFHAAWERYAESRLVAALNHHPQHFLTTHDVKEVKRIPKGLALYLARGGRKYFDFRSVSELIAKADALVGEKKNPFRSLSVGDKNYLDTLSAIRNYFTHQSDAALSAYKAKLNLTYGIRAVTEPGDFLVAVDRRAASAARGEARIKGLAEVIKNAISST